MRSFSFIAIAVNLAAALASPMSLKIRGQPIIPIVNGCISGQPGRLCVDERRDKGWRCVQDPKETDWQILVCLPPCEHTPAYAALTMKVEGTCPKGKHCCQQKL